MLQKHKDKMLRKAVIKKDIDNVIKYISKGANVDQKGNIGNSLVYTAINNDDYITFKELIDSSENIDNSDCLLKLFYKGGMDRYIQLLIEKGLDLQKQVWGETPLELAITGGNVSTILLLLDNDVLDNNTLPEEKIIIDIGHLGDVELFNKILDKVNPDLDTLNSVFMHFVKTDNNKIIKALLSKHNFIKDLSVNYLCEELLKKEDFKTINLLIENNLDIDPLVDFLLQNNNSNDLKKISKKVNLSKETKNKIENYVELKFSLDDENTVSKKIKSKDKKLEIIKFFQFGSAEILTLIKSKKDKFPPVVKNFNDVACKEEINAAYDALIKLDGKSPFWKPEEIKDSNQPRKGLVDVMGRNK